MKVKDRNTVNNQKGQVLIGLVLILLTLLTIGLIIIQRSTVDVTTSTQTDQASRAFSAAEAGIEQALQSNLQNGQFSTNNFLTNNSAYTVTTSARLPLPNQALEYPPTGKGEIAQFWLMDPNIDITSITRSTDPNTISLYQKDGIYIYFGDRNATSSQLPAIEINLITIDKNTQRLVASRAYIDTDPTRATNSNFLSCGTDPNYLLNPAPINTSLSSTGNATADRSFKCRVRVNTFYAGGSNILPVMIRTRMLYVDNQPVAAAPEGTTASLPPQATIYTSIGTSGQTRKTIQAFKLDNIAPFFFDYAIFSVADINKVN